MTEALSEKLRRVCNEVRRKPTPLADLIPLMQQAADAAARSEEQERLLRDALEAIKGYRRELNAATASRIEPSETEDAIVTFLREKVTPDQDACVHVWKVTQQGQTYMDTVCLKCGKTERSSWD